MSSKTVKTAVLSTLLCVASSAVLADRATRVEDVIWANDRIYDTVLTDTSFISPPEHSTDTLYNFGMSGLGGQRPVSDSAPGDSDYNGGRWSVKIVAFTAQGKAVHDPDGDGNVNFELTNAQAVLDHEALGHITIMDTTVYFECPLLP
jgi:hypothetical protein